MHAAVVRANMPGGVNEARLKNPTELIVPMVSAAPGFVAGYWLDTVEFRLVEASA